MKSAVGTIITGEQDSGDATNAWAGATCSVRVGTCSDGSNNYCWNPAPGATGSTGGCNSGTCNAGTTFTLSASASAAGGDTFTCNGNCPKLAAPSANSIATNVNNGDVVSCAQTVSANNSNYAAWIGWGSPDPSMSIETSVVHSGQSALEFNNTPSYVTPSGNWDGVTSWSPNTCVAHPADICTSNSDCPSGDTCATGAHVPSHPVTGSWTWNFWANTSSSGATCTGNFYRGSNYFFKNQSLSLTNDGRWHQYTYNFSGTDSGAPGQLWFNFTCNGGVIYVDDMYLGQANATTAFTKAVLSELQDLNVGSVRDSDSFGITSTNPGLTEAMQASTGRYQMPPEGGWIGQGVQQNEEYSFGDLVALAHAISPTTSPWMTMPEGWTDTEYTAFGNQLCSWESQYNFPAMFVECGNENWNGAQSWWKVSTTAAGAAYGMACGRAFGLITQACSDSHLRFFIDNQTGNTGVGAGAYAGFSTMPNTNQYGWSDHLYSSSGTDLKGQTVSQAIAGTMSQNYNSNFYGSFRPGDQYDDLGTICLDGTQKTALKPCNRVFGNYEYSAQNNFADAKTLSSQVNVGWGGAGIAMQTLILSLTYLPPAQSFVATNLFYLNNPNYAGTNIWSATAGISGTVQDFAPVWPWLNGQGLGLELYNKAVVVDSDANGDYHAVSGLPSGVYCAAFAHGTTNNYQLACVNTNPTSTSVSVTFPSATNVPTVADTVNYTNGMTDNNENSASLSIGNLSGGVSYSGQTGTFTIPALATAALLTSASPTPTPSISPTPSATATPSPSPTATPIVLQVSPANLNFGSITVGTVSAPQVVTLTNPSATAITGAHVATQWPFQLSGISCAPTIAANSSCTMNVIFEPQHTGIRSTSISISDSASNSPQLVAATGTGVVATTLASATVQSQPINTGVQRLAIDPGAQGSVGSASLRSNVLGNPGFEPVESERAIDVTDPTSTSFCESDSNHLFPANFYNGATFEVVYSAARDRVGALGKISGYDPTGAKCVNGAPAWNYAAGFNLQPDDIVVTHAAGALPSMSEGCSTPPSCGPVALWWFDDDPEWTTAFDQEPNGAGVQSIEVNLDGRSHSLNYYFDTNSSPINGQWKFAIHSKSLAATAPSCTAVLQRPGSATYFSYTWTPGPTWSQAGLTFLGHDGVAQSDRPAGLSISCSGPDGAIRLDDAYLGPAVSDGAWRSDAVVALKQLSPGYIRSQRGPGGNHYASLLSYPLTGQSSIGDVLNFSATYPVGETFDLSYRVGAKPWISIPVALTDSEYIALGRQLASLERQYPLPEVLVEFGNGNGAGGCGGACFKQNGSLSAAAYGVVANRAFSLIKKAAGGFGGNIKYAGSAQWQTDAGHGNSAGYMASLLPEAQYVAVAPYWDCENSIALSDGSLCNNAGVDQSLIESTASNVTAYGQELALLDGAPGASNMPTDGSVNVAAASGVSSASAPTQTILAALAAGVRVTGLFTALNLDLKGPASPNALAGPNALIDIQPGNAGQVRILSSRSTTEEIIKLLNRHAIGGNFYTVNGTPSGVSIGAFLQTDGWHLAVANSSSAPMSVSVAFPNAAAALPMHLEQIAYLPATNFSPASTTEVLISNAQSTINSPTSVSFTILAGGTTVGYP